MTLRITVVGAGIAGITTAYELAQRGHAVTVIDRRESVAAEGSFANAGLLSAGCVSPAAGRGLRPWLVRGLWSHDAALRWRPTRSVEQWRWLARWWRACGTQHPDQVRSMVGLAQASLARLDALCHQHQLVVERSRGVLLLMRSEREFMPTRRHVQMLHQFGVQAVELSAARAREIEPGLMGQGQLAGGVFLSDDGVGNCRQFAQQLREVCERQLGVRFLFNTAATQLVRHGSLWRIHLASTTLTGRDSLPIDRSRQTGDTPLHESDAVVLCGGADATMLVPSLARRVALRPVHGYSISYRLRPDAVAPRSAVVDVSAGVAITRLGERLRVSGGFSLADATPAAGHRQVAEEAALAPLLRSLDRWFPGAAERGHPQVWRGARAMLPDGPPLIGAATEPRLWLNLGHGAHGWTLASGASHLLAELFEEDIRGTKPQSKLDPRPFSLAHRA